MPDMSIREFMYFVPLILLVLWMGVYPLPVLDVMHVSVSHLIEQATSSKLADAAIIAQGAAAHVTGH